MTRSAVRLMLVCCCWLWACSGSDDQSPPAATNVVDAGVAANVGDSSVGVTSAALSYWQDMAPIFEDHCMRCHRDGGIAPFRLDVYAETKQFAQRIEQVTRERSMPPWSVASDGSCGDFANVEALSDDEIARIGQWVESGAREGTPVAISVPEGPTLGDAADVTELKTPDFQPEIQGGELAAFDEYRCFLFDAPSDAAAFITGYEVLPGTPEIVHHTLVAIIDPDAPADHSDPPGLTNLEQINALDAESPDREGWSCYGMAGEGVAIKAVPVVWAPGQGVITYPNHSGVALKKTDKIVIQVHYNLADPDNVGKRDQTKLRLRTTNDVDNVALFVTEDPFLGTLDDDQPAMLPPGQKSTTYTWTETGRQLGMGPVLEAQLYGVMPHMHQLGHQYHLTVSQDGQPEECAADVQSWDFHWQRMYFYEQPLTVKQDTKVSVTCDFDTSSVTYPVKPGWGTRNEMCLAVLFFTVPKGALGP